MFNYQDKILKKFRIIDAVSIAFNIAFLGAFAYSYYLYNNSSLSGGIFSIATMGCVFMLMLIFINRVKYKREIIVEAKKEAKYDKLDAILDDLKIGKIVCIQSSNDIGFVKMIENGKLFFYFKKENYKIERTLETGKMHIKVLLNDPKMSLYQNGFLFVIKEQEIMEKGDNR